MNNEPYTPKCSELIQLQYCKCLIPDHLAVGVVIAHLAGMTNKEHNQQLARIDSCLATLAYELKVLSMNNENIVAFDKAKLELDAARALIRQFMK